MNYLDYYPDYCCFDYYILGGVHFCLSSLVYPLYGKVEIKCFFKHHNGKVEIRCLFKTPNGKVEIRRLFNPLMVRL